MNYDQLYELQTMRVRRQAMEKSYPKEREHKLRKRKQELLAEKKDLIILEEKLKGQSRDLKRLQDEREGIVEEMKRINADLYSNRHSAKELTSMQNRLSNLENTLNNRTTRIDKENDSISLKRADLSERKNRLVERMKDYQGKVDEYLLERNRLMEKLTQLDEQIDAFLQDMGEAEQAFFKAEDRKFGIEMMSILKKGRFCSCCSMLLESDTIAAVKSDEGGVRCQNCGRVLYNLEE